MGRKKKRADGNAPTASVKIERGLAAKARNVAADRGVAVAEYLSGLLRASIERDFRALVKKTAEEEEG